MDQPTSTPPPPPAREPAPFEMPPDIMPPEQMGGKGQGEGQYPKKSFGSYLVMIFLVIILIVGGVLFAAWKGWISIGIFEGGKTTPAPTLSASPEISPEINPQISPQGSLSPSSSPQTTANVNDETRKKDLANIKNALKKYYDQKSVYPVSLTIVKTSDQNGSLYLALVPGYIESLPDDPTAPSLYYGYKSDGQTFELTAVLEDKSDAAGTMTNGYNLYKITNASIE